MLLRGVHRPMRGYKKRMGILKSDVSAKWEKELSKKQVIVFQAQGQYIQSPKNKALIKGSCGCSGEIIRYLIASRVKISVSLLCKMGSH